MMLSIKNIFFTLTLLLASARTYTMVYINYGYSASYNNTIKAYKCVNEGIMEGFNQMSIKAHSFSGSGTVKGKYVAIKCDECKVSGTIKGDTECTLAARKIDDTGTISGGKILILCDEFGFRGTLSCSTNCVIYAKQDFDYSMFKRNGAGKVTVVISKNDVEILTEEALIEKSFATLHNRCLGLAKEDVDDSIKNARTEAAMNLIPEKNLLEKLKRKIEAQVQYYKERLEQKRDPKALLKGAIEVGVGGVGLLAASLIYLKKTALANNFGMSSSHANYAAVFTAGIATLPLFASSFAFYDWLNPFYREKYEKHLMFIECIVHALKTPRVPEEKITTL